MKSDRNILLKKLKLRRLRSTQKRCYELANLILLKWTAPPRLTLVHGTIENTAIAEGFRFGHAWLEVSGCVFDPVLQDLFPRQKYYDARKAIAEVAYTQIQAARKIGDSSHHGPWHVVK